MFSRKFLTFTFIITTTIQLYAMSESNTIEQQLMKGMIEGSIVLDFQVYQFLEANNNDQFNLPHELVQLITFNAHLITKKLQLSCYEQYGNYIKNPFSILSFIKKCLKNKSMSCVSIASILKICLDHMGKSLSHIKYYNTTILHQLEYEQNLSYSDCAKICQLVEGKKVWDLLMVQNNAGYTVFHCSFCSVEFLIELLNMSPSPEELWQLTDKITTYNETVLFAWIRKSVRRWRNLSYAPHNIDSTVLGQSDNQTALEIINERSNVEDVIQKLLFAAPSREKAWEFINRPNNTSGETALDLAIRVKNREIIDLFELYRPKNT